MPVSLSKLPPIIVDKFFLENLNFLSFETKYKKNTTYIAKKGLYLRSPSSFFKAELKNNIHCFFLYSYKDSGLGRGAYGSVKLVLDINTSKIYSIKIYKLYTDRLVSKFDNEVGHLKTLDRHVASFKDSSSSKGYIVLPYYPGNLLYERISSLPTLEFISKDFLIEILHTFKLLLCNLESLHSKNIIHADIKSNNAIITIDSQRQDKPQPNIHFIQTHFIDFSNSLTLAPNKKFIKTNTVLGPKEFVDPASVVDNAFLYSKSSDYYTLGKLFNSLINRIIRRTLLYKLFPDIYYSTIQTIYDDLIYPMLCYQIDSRPSPAQLKDIVENLINQTKETPFNVYSNNDVAYTFDSAFIFRALHLQCMDYFKIFFELKNDIYDHMTHYEFFNELFTTPDTDFFTFVTSHFEGINIDSDSLLSLLLYAIENHDHHTIDFLWKKSESFFDCIEKNKNEIFFTCLTSDNKKFFKMFLMNLSIPIKYSNIEWHEFFHHVIKFDGSFKSDIYWLMSEFLKSKPKHLPLINRNKIQSLYKLMLKCERFYNIVRNDLKLFDDLQIIQDLYFDSLKEDDVLFVRSLINKYPGKFDLSLIYIGALRKMALNICNHMFNNVLSSKEKTDAAKKLLKTAIPYFTFLDHHQLLNKAKNIDALIEHWFKENKFEHIQSLFAYLHSKTYLINNLHTVIKGLSFNKKCIFYKHNLFTEKSHYTEVENLISNYQFSSREYSKTPRSIVYICLEFHIRNVLYPVLKQNIELLKDKDSLKSILVYALESSDNYNLEIIFNLLEQEFIPLLTFSSQEIKELMTHINSSSKYLIPLLDRTVTSGADELCFYNYCIKNGCAEGFLMMIDRISYASSCKALLEDWSRKALVHTIEYFPNIVDKVILLFHKNGYRLTSISPYYYCIDRLNKQTIYKDKELYDSNMYIRYFETLKNSYLDLYDCENLAKPRESVFLLAVNLPDTLPLEWLLNQFFCTKNYLPKIHMIINALISAVMLGKLACVKLFLIAGVTNHLSVLEIESIILSTLTNNNAVMLLTMLEDFADKALLSKIDVNKLLVNQDEQSWSARTFTTYMKKFAPNPEILPVYELRTEQSKDLQDKKGKEKNLDNEKGEGSSKNYLPSIP